jgi:hypothetical protein
MPIYRKLKSTNLKKISLSNSDHLLCRKDPHFYIGATAPNGEKNLVSSEVIEQL